jgi:lipopolysaccharide transport system permease protein
MGILGWCVGAKPVSVSGKLVRSIKKVKYLSQHRDLENYRDLVTVLVQKELKVRYGNKSLGYLWSIANPLAAALVYYFAFSIIFKVKTPDYPLVIISGIFPWQWIGNSIGSAPNMFIANSSIIKKVSFPTALIPLCTVLNHMIHFIMSIPVILAFMIFYHKSPTLVWLYGFPILLVIQLALTYGMSLILASINLFFRDLERLTGIVMNFVFYFTPVIFTMDRLPPKIRQFLSLNPFSNLVAAWRQLIMNGSLNTHDVLISSAHAAVFLVISYFIYRKLSWKFAEVI